MSDEERTIRDAFGNVDINLTGKDNNSGQGEGTVVPDIVAKRFNWGAFFLPVIWAIVYRKWVMLIVLLTNFVPFVGVLVSFGLKIYYGIEGNKWAWQQRQYKNIDEFHKTHKKWAAFGVVIYAISIIAAFAIIKSFLFDFNSYNRESNMANYKAMNKIEADSYRWSLKRTFSDLNVILVRSLMPPDSNIKNYLGSADKLAHKVCSHNTLVEKIIPGGCILKYSNDTTITFGELNPNCSGMTPCAKIYVDLNGDTPPNEETTDINYLKDRYVLYLHEQHVKPAPDSIEAKIIAGDE